MKISEKSTGSVRRKENSKNMDREEAKHLENFTQPTVSIFWCFADILFG